uniref:Dihydrouridine synthase 4 like n=1 Tax=Zonotrichia albicollis TaxID=44394 RepID=A0A8D2QBU6_ZONAL
MIDDIRETKECQLKDPMDLFHSGQVVKICAPMVRYSKLAFRTLVRKYSCDLCYTPMIVAADFVRSAKARDSEFTTNKEKCSESTCGLFSTRSALVLCICWIISFHQCSDTTLLLLNYSNCLHGK